jgi:hypothetical protein
LVEPLLFLPTIRDDISWVQEYESLEMKLGRNELATGIWPGSAEGWPIRMEMGIDTSTAGCTRMYITTD